MDPDADLVADFWHCLEEGRLEAALVLVGEHGTWRPLVGGREISGRIGMRRYLREVRSGGGSLSGRAYAIERRGEHIVVHGAIRYSGPGRFMESQGHWVHRVEDGAIADCIGVPTAVDAAALVTA
jgi:hypothetical protein